MPKFSDLYVALGFDDRRFKAGLNKSQSRMKKFSNQVSKLGGVIAGAFAVQSIISFGTQVIRTNVAFEKSMSSVKAITKATDEEFQQLTKSARSLAEVTTKTAQEVSALQKEFALIGFTTQEILNATAATIMLSEATGEDLAQAAQTAGATIRGFGKDADATQEVVDLMAMSFTSSALNLERWGESMKFVAPVARAANVSIEETAAMMSILADAGIHGSMAGTSLRMMMLRLTKTGEPLSTKLKDLAEKGITLADANDEVGQRAQTALLVLSEQIDTIERLTSQYHNATDAAKEMAQVQTDNVAGELDRLKSAWEEQTLKISGTTGAMQGFLKVVTSITKKISGFADGVIASHPALFTLLTIFKAISHEADKVGKNVGDDFFKKTKEELIESKTALENLLTEMDSGSRFYEILDNKLRKVNLTLEKLNASTNDGNDAKKAEISIIGQLKADLKELTDQRNLEVSPDILNRYNKLIELKEDELKQAQKYKRELKEIKAITDKLVSTQSDAIKQIPQRHDTDDISTKTFHPEVIDRIGELTEFYMMSIGELADLSTEEIVKLISKMDLMNQMSETFQTTLTTAGIAIGEAMGQMFTGDGGASSFFESILKVIAEFVKQFGAVLVSMGAALLLSPLTAGQGYGLIAGGTGLVALGEGLKGIELAKGGLVYGPTHALIGEYSGARSNPEVVAPLDKLKSMMGGGQFEFLPAVVRGSDIILAVDNTNKRRGIVR